MKLSDDELEAARDRAEQALHEYAVAVGAWPLSTYVYRLRAIMADIDTSADSEPKDGE